MKKKELKALGQKSVKELTELAEKTKNELVKARIDSGAGKLKDTQLVNKKRRDLARLKTVLREKELLALETGKTGGD